jgi:hypothetical protein
VQRNRGDAGLVLKTTDNALLPAPQPEPAPFGEEASTAPNFFDGVERNEAFADCMGYVIAEIRREWKHDIARLERQLLKCMGEAPENGAAHANPSPREQVCSRPTFDAGLWPP